MKFKFLSKSQEAETIPNFNINLQLEISDPCLNADVQQELNLVLGSSKGSWWKRPQCQ